MPQPDATTHTALVQPAPYDPAAIHTAAQRIDQQLRDGVICVNSRDARTLLTGFNHLIQYVAQGESRAGMEATKLANFRIGAILHQLGATEVTIDEATFAALDQAKAQLGVKGDEHTLTYALVFPEPDPAVPDTTTPEPDATNAQVEGADASDEPAA